MSERVKMVRQATVLTLVVVGMLLVFLAISADLLGFNITRGFGVLQIAQLLLGITALTLSGLLWFHSRRPEGVASLQADIGLRVVATGLVLAYVSGFSDLLQIGTHLVKCDPPAIITNCGPYIGAWQVWGIVLGVLFISGGFVLYTTSRGPRFDSSLSFLARGKTTTTKGN